RHFFEQRLDVRAQELERAVAGLANEVEVTRVAVRVLEAEAPLAEVDLARDAGFLHPLERAVHRGATDLLILAPDQIVQIVSGKVPFLPEEDVDDEVAFAGTLAAGRAK